MRAQAVAAGEGGAPTPRAPSSRAALRFGLVVGLFGLGVHLLYRFGDRLWQALAPLDRATAWMSAGLIRWSGLEVERAGAVLSHPDGFAYEIYYRCTGLVPALFLVVGLAALPGRGRAKAWGSLAGVLLLLAVNQIRLVSLFWVGVHHPRVFETVHGVFWEAGMIFFLLLFWWVWLRWWGVTREIGCRGPLT